MAHEPVSTDVGDLPDVARLAHDVAKTGKRHVLTENGAAIAVLSPARQRRRAAKAEAVAEAKPKVVRKRRNGVFTMDDPLWNIVGMFDDTEGPTDVSSNKHKYLAEAYMPESK